MGAVIKIKREIFFMVEKTARTKNNLHSEGIKLMRRMNEYCSVLIEYLILSSASLILFHVFMDETEFIMVENNESSEARWKTVK